MARRPHHVSYLRNFIFGVEDSLVSTVGLLSGIAIANVPRETIFLTGIVLIFVESFSMAMGSFLAEYSAEGFLSGSDEPTKHHFISGIIMFISYFVSGFIPLSSYLIWPVGTALKVSIVFSVFALLVLGVIAARISHIGVIKNSLRMAAVGGAAISVGLIAGSFLPKVAF